MKAVRGKTGKRHR